MEKNEFLPLLHRAFGECGSGTLPDQRSEELLLRLTELMLEKNAVMNVTAITDPYEICLKHYADSAQILPFFPQGAKVLDVGCGGGFPSLILAIFRPDLQVVGMDATGKKADYVKETVAALGLENLTVLTGRAEELAHTDLRESFDGVTARAVAALPMLCELCLAYVKVGGVFAAMKAKGAAEELALSAKAIHMMGGKAGTPCVYRFTYEGEPFERRILPIRKITPTNGTYPRAFAQIKKKPL